MKLYSVGSDTYHEPSGFWDSSINLMALFMDPFISLSWYLGCKRLNNIREWATDEVHSTYLKAPLVQHDFSNHSNEINWVL